MTAADRGDAAGGRQWEELAFRITLRDVYDAVHEIRTRVDLITTTHVVQEAALRELVTDSKDHEARIRQVERRQWPLPTVAILVSLLALAATVVVNLTKGG